VRTSDYSDDFHFPLRVTDDLIITASSRQKKAARESAPL
jgi:hypothetical protein